MNSLSPDPPNNSLDILLVEDSVDLSKAIELWLRASGYRTVTVATGREAERVAAKEYPCVLIVDLELPDFSGYEFLRRLKETPQSRKAQFIALSGDRDASAPRFAKEAGFDFFLNKPPHFENLKKILNIAFTSG